MLNAAQFRAAVEQYAPNNAPQLLNANTDWYDLVTQSAFGQDHNLAISNASETMNWRLSFGYLNQDGIIEGTEVERISLGFNFDQRLLDNRLNIRANLKGSRSFDRFTPGGVISNAAQFGPTQPVFDEDSQTGYYEWNEAVLQSPDNPLAILGLATDQATTYRSFGNVRADYRMPFLEALRANLDLGYDVTYAERETFFPSVLHGQQKTGNDGSDYRTNPSSVNGVLEAYLTYAAPLGAIPGTIDAAGGYSYAQQHAEYPWFLASGLSTDMLGGNGVVSARDIQNDQSIQESKLLSIFGRLNYNLNDRYLASLSLRRDGSSRFGEDNRWATFPAISIGWRLSEESFLKDRSPFSELKLRASWAKTGNQAFANYQQYSTYVVGDGQTQVQFGNEYVPTLRPSAVDPAIRWEETNAYNVGLDFAVMNSRLSGAIDWYTKNTDDLIFTVPVAAGTNLSNYLTTNIGSMKNRGIEFSLSYRLLEGRSGGLAWTTDFIASHNTNELTTINPLFGEDASRQRIPTGLVSGGVGTFIQVLQPGVPINSFFVFQHKRGPDGLPIYEDTDGSGTITTQDLYEDLNGDGTVNLDDRRPFHDPAPKWILGHSSYLAYGKFDLGMTLRAYLDNWVYNNVASNLGTYEEVKRGSPYNLHSSVLETGFETPQYLSDYYVEDASFLRLDNVTLGYSFTYGGRQMRAFGTVQSAFTITGYNGVDPTAGINGLDNNIYPRSRTFTFGLGMRF
jgi:TonB-linked SusC/RagA family outer membrane protein